MIPSCPVAPSEIQGFSKAHTYAQTSFEKASVLQRTPWKSLPAERGDAWRFLAFHPFEESAAAVDT
jgi:hypothetical protein